MADWRHPGFVKKRQQMLKARAILGERSHIVLIVKQTIFKMLE